MKIDEVWEQHNQYRQVRADPEGSGRMAGKCKCGALLVGHTHLQHLLGEMEKAAVERETRAWGDGYDTAEADYRGTGFYARGKRMNPFGREQAE